VIVGVEWSDSQPGRFIPEGNSSWYQLYKEAEWAPEPVWTTWKSENLCPYLGSKNSDPSVIQAIAVTILTALSQLVLGCGGDDDGDNDEKPETR
jgi:hypothetical protein